MRAARSTPNRSRGGIRSIAVGTALLIAALANWQPATGLAASVPPRVIVSEVHAAGSGNASYKADWFEVTNTGTTDVNVTGWKMDDDSNASGNAVALRGVTTIPAGRSAVFIEGSSDGLNDAALIASFVNAWFGSPVVPAGLLVGAYGGSGVGLGSGGDAVNLFDAAGTRVTGIRFGAAPAGLATLDNSAGQGSTTLPLPLVTSASVIEVNGAVRSFDGAEVGSPGLRLNASPLTGIDLSLYVRVGRYALPEPTQVTSPDPFNFLAQEASAVTYNWDTDSLFITGDGGRAIVQVSKTGQLIDTMTLGPGNSPQGTDFYDPEGLTYVGGGKFVMSEERDRQAVLFTYVPGTTLQRGDTQTVKLGSFVDNTGNEGLSYDPMTTAAPGRGFIIIKETQPQQVFQTSINFAAGTATNGSAATEPGNLFNPALANLPDLADVYALSNIPTLTGADTSRLLILSQESGEIVNISRTGVVASKLTIRADASDQISVPSMQHEGLTMDFNGVLYVVNENGGGDINHPELWVFAPSSIPNQPPTAIALTNRVDSIVENTSTASRLKVADITLTDDGIGTNTLSVAGPDAGFFEAESSGLYLKAGTVLDFEAKNSYSVAVAVDDTSIGATPDATAGYTLAVLDVVNENPPVLSSLVISEVVPWASGNSPYGADWFEVTNTGATPVDITGWKMDDNSNSSANAVALRGVTTIPAGRSAVFFEGNATGSTDASITAAFLQAWFATSTPPPGFLIGAYGGGGVGLSTDGDAVNLFDASGVRVTGVSFGPATTGRTFDNAAAAGSSVLPLPAISVLSVAGVRGAFGAADGVETGSPGTTAAKVIISEVSPWSSGNSPYGADWFEITNITSLPVDITGWRIDDDSNLFGNAVALRGVTTIPAGRSAVFFEGTATGNTDAALTASFATAWFGSPAPPAGFLIGAYGGGGVGLGTGGDQVNLFDSLGNRLTGVSVPSSTTGRTFDNTAGKGGITPPPPPADLLSTTGVHGAFVAADGVEIGSPGTIAIVLNGIELTQSGIIRDRRTGTYAQQLTLTNTTGVTVPGPLFVALDNISANAGVTNAAGTTTPLGSVYVAVPNSAGGLAPGTSLTVTVQFSNTTNGAITYTPRVLNGTPAP